MSADHEASFSITTVHVGPEAWADCSVYTNGRLPNLSVHGGSVSAIIYLCGEQVTPEQMRFARGLAREAERFAAEAERLHAEAQATQDSAPGAA